MPEAIGKYGRMGMCILAFGTICFGGAVERL